MYNRNNNPTITDTQVSIADVQQAVPVTIKRTVNGVTESRSSSDLGVLCGGAVGDTVPDNAGGTAWTVSSRVPINFWSSRKPVYSPKISRLTGDDWYGYAHVVSGFKTGGGIKKKALTGTDFVNSINSVSPRIGGVVPDAVWEHDRPLADGICAFRLTDFAGYWHLASNMFHIGAIVGQVDYLPIPYSDSDNSRNFEVFFEMYCRPVTGTIIPVELFGDCANYYPGVVISYSPSLYFVKTASTPVSTLISGSNWTYTSFKVNTKTEFLENMFTDYGHGHDYTLGPFMTGAKWTATLVLVSNEKTGESGFRHKLNSDDVVVRLQYQNGSETSDRECVDRRTLPLQQTKYMKFKSMKITLNLYKMSDPDNPSGITYKITDFRIWVNKLTAESVTLTVKADLSAYLGTVWVEGMPSASNVAVQYFSNPVTFSGTGEQNSYVSVMDHKYRITGTYAGNMNCNAKFYVMEGTTQLFEGGFAIDVYQLSSYYQVEIELL